MLHHNSALPAVVLPAGNPDMLTASSRALLGLLLVVAADAKAEIVHEPIGCMLADQFPLVEAVIEPSASVARARVYFKSALGSAYYFVEMTLQDGKFVGKLPALKQEASPITYSIRATTTDSGEHQTPEAEAHVASDASQCPEGLRVAKVGPPGAVTVFNAATSTDVLPAGFCPVARAHGLSAWTLALHGGPPQKASLMAGYVLGEGDGVLVAVEPGLAGGKLTVGYTQRGFCRRPLESYAAKVTLVRTWKRPWLADRRTTYLGMELSASLGVLPNLVANVGALRRLSAKVGSRDWIVTFGLGFGV